MNNGRVLKISEDEGKERFAAQNIFRAVTEEIELRGFASTPMRIAQIIAIELEYWNDGLRRIKGKNPYFQLLISTIPIIQYSM